MAEGTPITVNTMVGELSTKAGYGPENAPTEFYLRIKNEGGNSKYSYYAKMKSVSSTWKSFDPTDGTTALPMYWAGDGNNVLVTAATFDFRDATTLEPTTSAEVTIAGDQSDETKLESCDHLLQLTTSTEPNTSGITVTLNHIMAKLCIVINLGKDNTDTKNPLTNVKVSGTNLTRKYNFTDLKNPAWEDATTTTNVADITPCPGTFTAADATATTPTSATMKFEAIVVPQTAAQGELGISFEMGGKAYTWKSGELVQFEPNKRYTLNLKMNGGALSLSSVKATDWGTDVPLTSGTMSEEDTKGTLTVKSQTGGEVTEEAIAAAKDGVKLKIKGAINSADIEVLAKNTTIEELDLSDATIYSGTLAFIYNDPTTSYPSKLGNEKLKKVVLPTSLTEVPSMCFSKCSSLTDVTLPNSITTINNSAFGYCTSLKSIELPSGVTKIDSYAFTNTAFESIELPSGLTTLGSNAFSQCTSLKEITIPAGVKCTNNEDYTFWQCTSLTKVTYLSTSPSINSCDFDESGVQNIYLPNCDELPTASEYAFGYSSTTKPSNVNVYVTSDLLQKIENGTQTKSGLWSKSYINFQKITTNN